MCVSDLKKEIVGKIVKNLEIMDNANKLSLEDYINNYSKYVDKIIIDTQLNDKIVYQAGKAVLKVLDDINMQISLELYFQNTEGKYIRKEFESRKFIMTDYLNESAIKELISLNFMSFDIESPNT